MTLETIIKAWKEPQFRLSLSAAELAALPANPAGLVELNDADLAQMHGGNRGGKNSRSRGGGGGGSGSGGRSRS